jgi:pimeloyl-ACP methyl ester carboxylesterase
VRPGYQEDHPELFFLLRQISRLNPPRPRNFLGAVNPPPLQPGQPPRIPMFERLKEAGVPVFFIVGEYDMITPPDLIEMCHRLVRVSRYHLVRDSGHSAYWEKPDEFNEQVLSFLRDVDNGRLGGK